MSTLPNTTGQRHFEWSVADRLRKAREEAGMTQQQLADRIDVSQRTVSNYENPAHDGARKPLVVKQWAFATGFDYDLVMTGEPGPDSPDGLGVGPSGCDGEVIDIRARRNTPPGPTSLPLRHVA